MNVIQFWGQGHNYDSINSLMSQSNISYIFSVAHLHWSTGDIVTRRQLFNRIIPNLKSERLKEKDGCMANPQLVFSHNWICRRLILNYVDSLLLLY